MNNVYNSGFWCKFQLRANVSQGFIAAICQKNRFPQDLSTFPKTFYPSTNNKSEHGFATLTRLPGEAVESFSGYDQTRIVDLANYSSDVELFSSIVFALYDNLLRLASWKVTWKIASNLCLLRTLSISLVFIWLSFCAKNFSVGFCGKVYRENKSFWKDFLFPDTYFFT